LITNALQNKAHEGLDVEWVKKPSDGLEFIQKGKVRGVIVDTWAPSARRSWSFPRRRNTIL
jgi:hypothetical protein